MRQKAVLVFLLSWFAWQAAVPVNLALADIGRHIKNGELLLSGVWDIWYKNYYSYTHPDFSFINHHWLFGVFSYGFWRLGDFTLLSFVYLLVQLAALAVFFYLARRRASLVLTAALVLLSLPFAASRCEIRPEGISVLLCGVMWLIFQSANRSCFLLVLVFFLQVIWVNTHIFFVMGPVLALLWWWQARLDRDEAQGKFLLKAFVLMFVACLINPSGVSGALLPFSAVNGFGLNLVENQPLIFMMQHFKKDILYYYYFVSVALLMVPFIFLIRKDGIRPHLMMMLLAGVMCFLGFKGVRLLGPYGYCWIALSAYAWGNWMKSWSDRRQKQGTALLLTAGLLAAVMVNPPWAKKHGFGLEGGVNSAAEFFKQHKIQGPVLNNYDLGGYLIFHFNPQMKFFTDNRQEAFPKDFFIKTMTPMLFDEFAWQAQDAAWGFNVIFFSRNPWEKQFLLKRYYDPAWALVYRDDYAVIMVRRVAQNKVVIDAFETPIPRPSI